MDASRDSQLSERSQRLLDRNVIKDRSTSTSDEPMEEKDRSVAAAMASDYLGSTRKPPQSAFRSVPDSFAPPMFGG